MFKKFLLMSLCALLSLGMLQAQSSDCGSINVPYQEGFESVEEFALPACWTTIGSATYPRVSAIRGSNGTSQSLYFSMYQRSYLVMPALAVTTIKSVTLTFDLYTQSAGQVQIGLLSNPNDTTTFTLVQSVNAGQLSWVPVTVSFAATDANATNIAIVTDCSVYLDNFVITGTSSNPGTPDTPDTPDTTVVPETPVIPDLPLITGFEDDDDNALWNVTTTTAGVNLFAFGTAVNNGGTKSLYVSNDGGTTAAYTNTSATITFVHRPFHLANDGTLLISYDWACRGESGYDKGRVFIAPATADISALTSSEISNLMSNYTTNPAGWLNADGASNLSGVDSWTTKSIELDLTAGDYLFVIGWKCDASGGNNPTFMFDNLSVREKVCYAQNLAAAVGATDVTVTADSDCPTVEVEITDENNTLVVDTVATLPFAYNSLQASTNYNVRLRGFCLSGDTTEWLSAAFITLCSDLTVNAQNHFTDDFESYTASTNSYMGCWLVGKDDSGTRPYVTTSSYTGGGQSVALSGTSIHYGYIATPNITGTPINQLRVKFKASLAYTSYSMEVGVMTDPLDYSTFVPVKRIFPELAGWGSYIVDFANYTGNGRSIAFRTNGNNFNIDDVEILPTPSCLEPTLAVTTSVGTIHAHITPAFATDNAWDLMVKTTMNANDSVAPVYNQTVNDTNVVITGLNNLTTYYVFVRTHCSATEQSEWIMKSIATPCGYYSIPYSHDFSTFPGNCWFRYSGKLADVLAGTTQIASSSNGWFQCTNGKGIAETHTKVNLWSNSQYYWLVSPEFNLEGAVELNFDLALTTYNSTNACTPGNQNTHRFAVVTSTDGGNTWNILAEWNNSGSANVYDSIPASAMHVNLPVPNVFAGSLKIGFYGESAAGGSDLDLHIGNIEVTAAGGDQPGDTTIVVADPVFTPAPGTYNDSVVVTINCDTEDAILFYQIVTADSDPEFGFGAPQIYNGPITLTTTSTITVVAVVMGDDDDYMSQEVSATYTIIPTVVPEPDTVALADHICLGSDYTANGFNLPVQDSVGVFTFSRLDNDTVFELTLTVNSTSAETVDVAICDTDLPYAWNGEDYTATGTYTYTTVAANGCDSVVTLNLTVNTSFVGADTLDLTDAELPYTWNGIDIEAAGEYTFNGTTAEGCDSVITLTVTVTPVGLEYAENGMFNITPNPVEKGGVVRIDATVNESAVVELFTANGKLVARSEHNAETIYVTMPQVAGLYMVRLTTETGRVMYGKVIVR